ncbi:MAG TPA: macro domain-containing protein [Gemmatimonadaceae bacterium]|nr:macro domain-containing protein [Gemmatimonadaceae bacterium]
MIQLRIDDLAFVQADALAWPVTAELRPTTPLLRRVEVAGGPALAAQLVAREPLPVGSAVVTGAGELPVELLVSAVVASDLEAVSRSSVRRALISALQRASDWRMGALAVAPFGLGAGNLEIEDCAEIMVDVISSHMARSSHPVAVTIVLESSTEEEVFAAALGRVAQ